MYRFCFISFLLLNSLSFSQEVVLIQNSVNESALPKQFRLCTKPLNKRKIVETGFTNLNASASGQFSELGLREMLKVLPNKNVIIVDLRQESHGFLNGNGISWCGYRNWANRGKTIGEIESDEMSRLNDVARKKTVVVMTKTPRESFNINVQDTFTEQALAKAYGLEYVRLPVTDHLHPERHEVDQFIMFLNGLSSDKWLHFHCSGGKGRSSTFFLMYDMYRNAKEISFEDIMQRQIVIGGKDLTALESNDWKYCYASKRLEFLKQFYRYCRDGNPKNQLWSEWLAQVGHDGL